MRLYPTEHFVRKYNQFSQQPQGKTDKTLKFLLNNIRHPSLRAKKYDEERGIWQARIDKKYRFYFLIKKDIYILLDIKRH